MNFSLNLFCCPILSKRTYLAFQIKHHLRNPHVFHRHWQIAVHGFGWAFGLDIGWIGAALAFRWQGRGQRRRGLWDGARTPSIRSRVRLTTEVTINNTSLHLFLPVCSWCFEAVGAVFALLSHLAWRLIRVWNLPSDFDLAHFERFPGSYRLKLFWFW